MKLQNITRLIMAAAVSAFVGNVASAQEVTLRLHHFLPPQAPVPAMVLKPWVERIKQTSNGRLEIQQFDAMALGGRPPDLMDQARDGVVDISMTVVGYTPGRFPRTEVFELPFMMTDAVATAAAFWEMVESDWQDSEYRDIKVLGAWVHGPGVVHSKGGVTQLEDMKGLALRGPTRVINDLLSELGAKPIGMPLPTVPEALSKGVVKGTVIPWEVSTAIRVSELVENHTEFAGEEALYTAAIVLVMNREKYEALPEDLRAILDAETGAKFSTFATKLMREMDAVGREIAVQAGNTIVELDEAETARWKDAAQPVIKRWVDDMNEKGIDGEALIERARDLIAKHGG